MEGIYCLEIIVEDSFNLKVGALGDVLFTEGIYYYIGSGQKNCERRISRHLLKNKNIHWHIDYLLSGKSATVKNIYYKSATKPEECLLARAFAEKGKAIKNFGSSDCNCTSHLYLINSGSNSLLMHMEKLNLNKFRKM